MDTRGTTPTATGEPHGEPVDVRVTVVDGRGRAADVRVRCSASTTVDELVAGMVEAGVRGERDPGPYVEDRRLEPSEPVGASLLHGSVLRVAPAPPQPPALRELRVVGGLGAGTVHALRAGTTVVGRHRTADVRLDDDRVSRAHVRIVVDALGVTVADLGSTNGSRVEGRRVPPDAVVWPEGARLRVGDSLLELGSPDPVLPRPRPTCGRLPVATPPRLRDPAPTREVRFPEPPAARRPTPVPLAATIAPLAVGVAAALLLRSATLLLFALLTPLVTVTGAVSDRAQVRREDLEARRRHRTALRAAHHALAEAVAAETVQRNADDPDCVSVGRMAAGRGPRLWERRRGDDDVLRVRLGTADLPARVRVVGGPGAVCPGVPVTVDLVAAGALGVVGGREEVLAVARAVVGSAAVLHPPTLLGVEVVTVDPGAWSWSRWLPHAREAGAGPGGARLDALLEAVGSRCRAEDTDDASGSGRRTLLVVDDPGLRDHPALGALAERGPGSGVHLLCLAPDLRALPPACSAVLAPGPDGWVLRQDGLPDVTGVSPDGASTAWSEAVARALAPLVARGGEEASAVPDEVAWRDLEGLRLSGSRSDVEQVLERWSGGGSGPEVRVGTSAAGTVTLDLRRAGPHGLVAGTTGSGKSELLQTLVAGLALANPPEALQLVLVDYKGGAAFGPCVDLPHTAGLVTDLDPASTRRALASLTAELRRREALLLRAGVPDLEAYERRTSDATPAPPRLPRLVLVVDEFATLAEELPDFVGGLVGVAQRGRSLGVHLVLATQRPEGSVSQDIRANTTLRLCLAVARESESRDVLDVPDAARIGRDRPGRAFLRRGPEDLVLLQTARVTVPAVAPATQVPPLRVEIVPPAPEAGGRAARRPADEQLAETGGPTDLDLLVAACTAAAARRAVPLPPRPWLEPLPPRLDLADLAAHAGPEHTDEALVPFALQDVPDEQGRRVLSLDLRGNLAVVGGPRSGRTTTLLTVAGAAATRLGPDRLHLVGLDFGGTDLRSLHGLPHCGAVVSGDEPDRLGRLVAALTREVARRRALAPGDGATPHLLVLVDQWDAFLAGHADVDAGRLVDALTGVLREGPAVGVSTAVTSDRSALVGRVAGLLPQRLLLRLPDAGDYAAVGVRPRDVPTDLPAGRGLDDSGLLTQVALLDADPALPPSQALSGLRVRRQRPGGPEPLRVDPLPARVSPREVEALRRSGRAAGRVLTPGVGGDRLGPLDVDLDVAGPVFLVAGAPRSGRSTALLSCLLSLDVRGTPDGRPAHVVVLAPRPGPLRTPPDLGVPVTVVVASPTDVHDVLAAATVLVVDDADQVSDPLAVAALDSVLGAARDTGTTVLVGGTTSALLGCYRPWAEEARRARTGLLLGPESHADGDLLGCRLPRGAGDVLPLPGRGLLVVRGEPEPVQVALPEPARDVRGGAMRSVA